MSFTTLSDCINLDNMYRPQNRTSCVPTTAMHILVLFVTHDLWDTETGAKESTEEIKKPNWPLNCLALLYAKSFAEINMVSLIRKSRTILN